MNSIPKQMVPISRVDPVRINVQGYPVVSRTSSFRLEPRVFPRIWVQLGRSGDLCIVLRPLKVIREWTGQKPYLITSKDFISLLDGVSYVEPICSSQGWYGSMSEVQAFAKSYFGEEARILQCHSKDWAVEKAKWTSYQESMWDRTGVPLDVCRESPLVFDRRNQAREEALIRQVKPNGKPILLYNFTGISSPFQRALKIIQELRRHEKDFQLVDLGVIRGFRIYDLLGFYDRACGLVTSDTVTLHLNAASQLPMIAYTQDGWNASTPYRKNTICEIKYYQALGKLPQLHQAIDKLKR